MTNLYADLAWLPRAPEDFTAQCRALGEAPLASFAAQARFLAGHGLNGNQLVRLAKLVAKHETIPGLLPLRLGILSNATTDFIVPAIVATGLRYGLHIIPTVAPYGQVVQMAFDPSSLLNSTKLDAVLVALDHHGLNLESTPGDETAAAHAVTQNVDLLDRVRTALKAGSGATIILQTLARPPETYLGSFDAMMPGALGYQIASFNRQLAARLHGSPDRLLDVAGLAETVGLGHWHDPLTWNMAKQPFAHDLIPLYADHLGRLAGAMKGKSRKVLVLDLDNTVWGGIIGDDGMDGIKIAQGDATGEAHLAVQRTALALRERGIVLAVSSKNTDEIARQVFREHPEMLLREEHISVFQANWNDKASNIKTIAETLSLGTDSFVFLDDNPVERGLIRRLLPEVAVPELPEDPALYARLLLAGGYFEAVGFSSEDRQRAAFYAANAQRVALQSQMGGVEDYLKSLGMTIYFRHFDDVGQARISQLINKSNQFNLTTRRYTEQDVATVRDDPAAFTLQVRLTDTFGDNGMISVVICRTKDEDWEIDTWLMSCRVLSRRVEFAVLDELIAQAQSRGISRLIGLYRPTEKNAMVKDHYAKLGFTLDETHPNGETVWTRRIDLGPSAEPFQGTTDRACVVAQLA